MNIELINSTTTYIDQCSMALYESSLGKIYFPSIEKAKDAVIEFDKTNQLLIAIQNRTQFIGFIGYLETGAFHSFPYIHLFVIAKEKRNNGYGQKVLELFEKRFTGKRDKVFLVVGDYNLHAKHFYEKNGYIEIGCIPELYRPKINEYLMMKKIV